MIRSALRIGLSRVPGLVAIIVALVAVGVAVAYFTSTGSGTAHASVGTLNPATAVSAPTPSTSSVSVSWTAPTPPGGAFPTYFVVQRSADGGTSWVSAGGNCPTSSSAHFAASSCSDNASTSGNYVYRVTAYWQSWTSVSANSTNVLVDSIAPISSASSPQFDHSGSFTPSYTASDTGGSGLKTIQLFAKGPSDSSYSAVGSAVTISGNSASGNFASYTASEGQGTYSFYSVATDQAGNVQTTPASAQSNTIEDTVAPTGGSITANGSASSSFNNTGTVPLSATNFTDGGSGIASNTITRATGTLTNGTCGTLSGATAVTISAGNDSSTLSSGCYQYALTGTDNAGNTATATSAIVKVDTVAPTGGALSVNGTAASSGGSSTYNGTGSYSIASITDFTDSGSGLASSTLVRDQATLSSSDGIAGGTCGTTFTGATTIASRTTPIAQTLTGPTCYRYTLTGTDNVGNAASISTIVKVDTTVPSTPTVSVTSATGSTFISGSTVYTNPQAGKSGGFTTSATTTDADSGIQKVNFPSLTGFTSGGGDISSSPFTTTYAWSGTGATASGAQTVIATNNAGLTANKTSAFTITPDINAPAGGSISYSNTTTALSPSLTLANGTDGGSGLNVNSGTVLRASATLTGGTNCGSFGAFSSIATGVTASTYNDTNPTGGNCYKYEYQVSDNVGNTATYTSANVAKVPPMPVSIASASNNSNDTPQAGEKLVLTYNEAMDASTVCTGFTGTSGTTSAATVTLTKMSGGTTGATINTCPNVATAATSLSLGGTYAGNANGSTVTFGGSTVSFSAAGVLTIQLGSTIGGTGTPQTATGSPFTDTWSPSTTTKDPAGNTLVLPGGSALSGSATHHF